MKLTIAATLLAALFVTPAIASPGKDAGRGKAMRAKVLKKYDLNSDGKIDREERKAMHDAIQADLLAKYDADGNGELSGAERQVMHNDRVAKRFESLDTNNDGVLSFDEFKAGKQHMGRRGRGKGKRHMRGGKGKFGHKWNKADADTAQ